MSKIKFPREHEVDDGFEISTSFLDKIQKIIDLKEDRFGCIGWEDIEMVLLAVEELMEEENE